MTTLYQTAKRIVPAAARRGEFGNVSKACKLMGYHRDTFYEVRRARSVAWPRSLRRRVCP